MNFSFYMLFVQRGQNGLYDSSSPSSLNWWHFRLNGVRDVHWFHNALKKSTNRRIMRLILNKKKTIASNWRRWTGKTGHQIRLATNSTVSKIYSINRQIYIVSFVVQFFVFVFQLFFFYYYFFESFSSRFFYVRNRIDLLCICSAITVFFSALRFGLNKSVQCFRWFDINLFSWVFKLISGSVQQPYAMCGRIRPRLLFFFIFSIRDRYWGFGLVIIIFFILFDAHEMNENKMFNVSIAAKILVKTHWSMRLRIVG